ncbi:MAG: hypothetical protein AAFO89_13300, partial [Planctomycetota bacterium]
MRSIEAVVLWMTWTDEAAECDFPFPHPTGNGEYRSAARDGPESADGRSASGGRMSLRNTPETAKAPVETEAFSKRGGRDSNPQPPDRQSGT